MNASGARKIKILGIVIGVTAAVCLIIKYLLPLLTPFVIAFLIAVIIEKPVKFLTARLRLRRSVSAGIMVIFVFAVLAAVIIWGGRSIIRQLNRLMANFDMYVSEISGVVEDCCCKIDECFGLKDGTSFDVVSEQFVKMSDGLGDNVVPAIMNKSWNVISGFVVFFTAMAFTVMSAAFFSKDMEKMKSMAERSVFREEVYFFSDRLKNILGTYLKTQLIIMTLTCVICTIGLYCMGNSYALLLGVLIGIIDAFPILGTGTVFVPWSVVLVIMGRYKSAAAIMAIYIICYYTREFLEPRLMGHKLGISPIIMLVSLYVGLLIFGILGVITGPIAAILIKEISEQLIKKLVET